MKDDEMNRLIGEWLADKRQKRGLSQQDVADIMGTTKTAVHYWETGKRHIFGTHIISYCLAVNASPDELANFIKGLMV